MASIKTKFLNKNFIDDELGELTVGRGIEAARRQKELDKAADNAVDAFIKVEKEVNEAKKKLEKEIAELQEKQAKKNTFAIEQAIKAKQKEIEAEEKRAKLAEENVDKQFEEVRKNLTLMREVEKARGVNLKDELEVLKIEQERNELMKEYDRQMESVNMKYKATLSNKTLSPEEKQAKLKELSAERRALERGKLRESGEDVSQILDALGKGAQDIFGGDLGSMLGSSLKEGGLLGDQLAPFLEKSLGEGALSGLGESIGGALGGVAESLGLGGIAAGIGEMVPGVGLIIAGIQQVVGIVSFIGNSLKELRKDITQSIDKAASQLSNYYSVINANLEGSYYSGGKLLTDIGAMGGNSAYKSISTNAEIALGLSRFVKQTDYLNQIATLSNQGLVNDIEQRAILQTIRDKTLTSFDVSNTALTRLVRLGEQNSVSQFGVELQLKRMLNKFGDSSYLQSLFDSVSDAILDASVATTSDLTYFNSTVQTWLGAMYSAGISDNVVSSIAQGINALGSGNVSALAQDESIQRLFLLSMDRVGLDYADILQKGLTADTTNKLLSSIVEYLNEIATNTEDNLVLKSSYSGLFNMSTTDMQAINTVYKKIGEISGYIVNDKQAKNETLNVVSKGVVKNTLAAERFDNLIENFSYTFGSNIADNNVLYSTYKMADISYNILDKFSQVGGALGKLVGTMKIIPAVQQFGIAGISMINMLGSVAKGATDGQNSLVRLLNSTSPGISESGSSTSSSSSSSESSSSLTSFKETLTKTIGESQSQQDSWSKDEEKDNELGVLKEISKALMKKDGNYAFAVSLEGMSNEVLKSFASIFADEDAMMKTFQGDNKVLKDALFGYMGDTTSNSGTPT